jgi:hypothetical protein
LTWWIGLPAEGFSQCCAAHFDVKLSTKYFTRDNPNPCLCTPAFAAVALADRNRPNFIAVSLLFAGAFMGLRCATWLQRVASRLINIEGLTADSRALRRE